MNTGILTGIGGLKGNFLKSSVAANAVALLEWNDGESQVNSYFAVINEKKGAINYC